MLPFIEEMQRMGYRIDSLYMAKSISSCVSVTMLLHVPMNCDHAKILEEIRILPGVVYAEDV